MKRRLLTLCVLLTGACYGSQQSACGTGPTPIPPPAPSPTVVVVLPSPSPSASPSPTATPISLCDLLPPSTATTCKVDQPLLEFRVGLAANAIKPPIPGTESAYVEALLASLRSQGVCAAHHPTAADEIIVKLANTYSETYDVWNAAQYPQVLYIQTCTPAKF